MDVISESINNPLRLLIGWGMVDPTTLPPSSVILMYWAGGAFLMAAKRLSEYREIVASHGKDLLARYRASFAGYTEASLTASCFFYSLLSVFFLAVFLIKYRIEYLLTVPVIIALFAAYILLAMHPGSSAQRPERLFKERGLVALVLLLARIVLRSQSGRYPRAVGADGSAIYKHRMSDADGHGVFDWHAIRLVAFDVDGTLYEQRRLRALMAFALLADTLSKRNLGTLLVLRTYRKLREQVGEQEVRDFDQALLEATSAATSRPIGEVRGHRTGMDGGAAAASSDGMPIPRGC